MSANTLYNLCGFNGETHLFLPPPPPPIKKKSNPTSCPKKEQKRGSTGPTKYTPSETWKLPKGRSCTWNPVVFPFWWQDHLEGFSLLGCFSLFQGSPGSFHVRLGEPSTPALAIRLAPHDRRLEAQLGRQHPQLGCVQNRKKNN